MFNYYELIIYFLNLLTCLHAWMVERLGEPSTHHGPCSQWRI